MIFNLFSKIETYEGEIMSSHLLIKAKTSSKILLQAVAIAKEIEALLSAYKESSEISQINNNAGIKPVTCSALTLEALEISLEIAKVTQGKFDPTIGALTQKGYGFGTNKEKLLSSSEKKYKRSLVDYKALHVKDSTAYLSKKNMAIDLGGMGKGFAADKIINFLKDKGVKQALVSVGGEIYTYGKVWHVGIQHPRKNTLLAQITTTKNDTQITSSGDYERFIKDRSHHHILEPHTAKSANYLSSLSLISNTLDAARMDALNTALFQMSESESKEILTHFNVATLRVDKALHVEDSALLYEKVSSLKIIQ